MSEINIMKVIQSFSRPVLLAELVETTKQCNEEVVRCVSLLCTEQKLYMKNLSKDTFIVWENKNVRDTFQRFADSTPQRLFKIPFASSPTPQCSHEATEEIDVKITKEKLYNLECQLQNYSDSDVRLQLYISKLHEYNEIKDTGIVLIGKLAEVESLTTANLYETFGLQVED